MLKTFLYFYNKLSGVQATRLFFMMMMMMMMMTMMMMMMMMMMMTMTMMMMTMMRKDKTWRNTLRDASHLGHNASLDLHQPKTFWMLAQKPISGHTSFIENNGKQYKSSFTHIFRTRTWALMLNVEHHSHRHHRPLNQRADFQLRKQQTPFGNLVLPIICLLSFSFCCVLVCWL